jgi:DNA recombination protein RmuC
MVDAENNSDREMEKKLFKSDVAAKLKQVEKYIDTEKGTLDYAVMFVPNEALFSFIAKEFGEIINDAFRKKILIVSPFSFIPITKTVLEMHKSFTMENSLRNLMVMFTDFSKQWGMFKGEFEKFDKSIKTLRDGYDQINTTRFKEMDRRVKKIESHSVGQIEKDELKLIE